MKADLPTAQLRSLWKEAFGDTDAFLDSFFETAFSPERCRYIAVDGCVAAALYWFDCRCDGARLAYIYAVATAKIHRGKGLCRTLMEDTHTHLKAAGYAGSILVPGEKELFAMYEKMGYAPFSGMDTLSCRAGTPVSIREISPAEYAALRTQHLPHRGVEQDGMEFLASYAKLYAGSDFILAATEETGLELLGNRAATPGILAALGKKEGSFRIPGSTPFAMYRPLTNFSAPGYFGIAFD